MALLGTPALQVGQSRNTNTECSCRQDTGWIRRHCEVGLELRAEERRNITAALKAAAAHNRTDFGRVLAALHPAQASRFTAVVLISKIAQHLIKLRLDGMTRDEVGPTPSPTLSLLCGQFLTDCEIRRLRVCFAPLLQRLESEQKAYESTCMARFHELHGDRTIWFSRGQPKYYKHRSYLGSVVMQGHDRQWPDFFSRPLRTLHFATPDINVEDWLDSWPTQHATLRL